MNLKNQHLSKTGTLKGIFPVVLIFCSSFISGQSAINILDLYRRSFPEKSARTITTNAQIGDYTYHTSVGGISFEGVAYPAASLINEKISLDFADNRLVIQIGTKTFYPNLPFWQLAPIVNFADSPYTVASSQLGDTTNNQGAKYRFHPAFLDNLLGLRLFQANLLNLTDILWDLPIDAQRRYILAPSEQPFTPVRDSTLHRTIYEKLAKGANFTSFVLTDKDVNYVFEIVGSDLKLSGRPYYYFTRMESDTANIRKLRTQLLECYDEIETQAKILLKDDYTPALNPRTGLGNLVAALTKRKQEKVFNPYSMQYMTKALVTLDSLNELTNEKIGIKFQVLNDYTQSFKPYWDLLKKFNPPVYSAVENTAQWSAFFRYVRKTNPANWSQFVKKIEAGGKPDAPAVQTPTFSEINYFRYFDEREKKKQ